MSAPMTHERLTEIRERAQAATKGPWECYPSMGADFVGYVGGDYLRGVGDLSFGEGEQAEADKAFTLAAREDVPALLAEVERLREQLAAFVPPGALGAGETPALCGTCKDRLCVPGLPGCARCVAEQVERLREEERRQRETADAASRGWRIEVAEVERLRAELAETTHALEVTGEKVTALRKQRDTAEAERDAARADLAAFWDAGRTEDLAGLVRDYLGPAVDWQTTNGGAPEWLVQAVLDLLAPVAATRDAAHSELAEIHEQLREARTAQERLADDMERLIAEVKDERRRRAEYVRAVETERDTARAELAEERARHGELVAEMQRARQAADAERVLTDGWRDKAERLAEQKVSKWVTSDVVTARSEFGNGYREAMRDVRDLLNGGRAAAT